MRTCTFNYETLINIYRARKNHKLAEWHTFSDWIEKLPCAPGETITEEEKKTLIPIERIKMVMRWSGPRMILYHPLAAIRHLLNTRTGLDNQRQLGT